MNVHQDLNLTSFKVKHHDYINAEHVDNLNSNGKYLITVWHSFEGFRFYLNRKLKKKHPHVRAGYFFNLLTIFKSKFKLKVCIRNSLGTRTCQYQYNLSCHNLRIFTTKVSNFFFYKLKPSENKLICHIKFHIVKQTSTHPQKKKNMKNNQVVMIN